MSDCSSEAMKPKDMDMIKSPNASKTCGMCQHQEYCHTPSESSLAEVCARFRPIGESYLNGPDPLEQRYQQLEQVVREMFYDLDPYCAFPYREQLEALGVNVDD